MPEDKRELILEVKTNAADAAKDVKKLSGAVDDLGDAQQEQSQKEKTANTERTRAAGNLRQILEAMLSQLRDVNAMLGTVSQSSKRAADTAEQAFKKAMVINRAIRKEKNLADREEAKRQVDARENYKAEQSRNHDRLRLLKTLAAGGAAIGLGKMAFGMASNIAGRGMSFVNAGALTGVDTAYIQGLNYLIKGRGGAEGSAAQSIGALSQMLFNIRRGYANPDLAAAQHLGNAPWNGTPQEFLAYLANRLPQLSPQEALAATSGLGLSPELIALLRSAGGADGWRKMIDQAAQQAPDLAKEAEKTQALINDVLAGIDEFRIEMIGWLTETFKDFSPEQIKEMAKTGAQILGLLAIIKAIQLAAHPLAAGVVGAWLATPYIVKAYSKLPRDTGVDAAMGIGEGVDAKGSSVFEDGKLPDKPEFRNPFFDLWNGIKGFWNGSPWMWQYRKLKEQEAMIRRNPFNFFSGRDWFNMTNPGSAGDTNNSQLAVTVENINITTRDDPQSMANATQDGIMAAGLRLVDASTAMPYQIG